MGCPRSQIIICAGGRVVAYATDCRRYDAELILNSCAHYISIVYLTTWRKKEA